MPDGSSLRYLDGLAKLLRDEGGKVLLVSSSSLAQRLRTTLPDGVNVVAGRAAGFDLTPLAGRTVVADADDLAHAALAAGAVRAGVVDQAVLVEALETGATGDALQAAIRTAARRVEPTPAAPASTPAIPVEPATAPHPHDGPQPLTGGSDDPVPPEFTDEALAQRFTAIHGDTLRFVQAWGKWFEWDGARWKPDTTLHAFDLARAVCRRAAAEADQPRAAKQCAGAATVAAVEKLARADRKHAATTDTWDTDPWLLNTPGGVVNLRDGKMRPHRPELHMTKITAVAPAGDCPTWRTFLDRATNGDTDLAEFLQRMAGYSLTGSTREHALFFVYGTGGNGKGVFLNTISAVAGGYATTSPMETFTASATERHPTDLAMLRGSRLVTAQETEEGRQWAESKIKSLTGGDPITARFMRQDFFTFTPQFKLIIAGNHKPGLRNVDEAIRRRLHLIPFTVTIRPEERDPDLADKLKAEWPGILKWMIQGGLEWQRIGLAPPFAVLDATEGYLGAEDAFGLWMGDCLEAAPRWFEAGADLFTSWRRWAEAAGEAPGSQKRFSQNIQARGATAARQGPMKVRGFEGFRLIRPDYTEDQRHAG